jgi:hypothetical protein
MQSWTARHRVVAALPEPAYTRFRRRLALARHGAADTGDAGRAPRYKDRDRASARAKRETIVQRARLHFLRRLRTVDAAACVA